MPPKEGLGPEDNTKLLLSALPYLEGKLPWEEIALACNITSAGAAAKRWQRLLKAHNITLGGHKSAAGDLAGKKNDTKDPSGSDSGDDHGAGNPPKAEPKKRKPGKAGEAGGTRRPSKKIKKEQIKQEQIDSEEEAEFGAGSPGVTAGDDELA